MSQAPSIQSDIDSLKSIIPPGLVEGYDGILKSIEDGGHQDSYQSFQEQLLSLLVPLTDAHDVHNFSRTKDIAVYSVRVQSELQRIFRDWDMWCTSTGNAFPIRTAVFTDATATADSSAASSTATSTATTQSGSSGELWDMDANSPAATISNTYNNNSSAIISDLENDQWRGQISMEPVCDICSRPGGDAGFLYCPTSQCSLRVHQVITYITALHTERCAES
jgi:hypothetical protein